MDDSERGRLRWILGAVRDAEQYLAGVEDAAPWPDDAEFHATIYESLRAHLDLLDQVPLWAVISERDLSTLNPDNLETLLADPAGVRRLREALHVSTNVIESLLDGRITIFDPRIDSGHSSGTATVSRGEQVVAVERVVGNDQALPITPATVSVEAVPLEVVRKSLPARATLPPDTREEIDAILPENIDPASPISHQRVDATLSPEERAAIEALLGELYPAVDSTAHMLDRDDVADIRAQLDAMQMQLKSPHPARRIVVGMLKILVAILVGLATEAIWESHGDKIMELIRGLGG